MQPARFLSLVIAAWRGQDSRPVFSTTSRFTRSKSGGLRVPKMNNGRRVYTYDTPRCLIYEQVCHSCFDVDAGYVDAVARDCIAFSPLQLCVMTCYSGGGEWIDIKGW